MNDPQTVECLGISFPSEDARREHFLQLLAEKLQDPNFRSQQGFPHGTDEAILAMSDPPWYTACPNPWLGEYVQHYGKTYDPKEEYSREPLAVNVTEGKTSHLYRAHSYHTKVPHLAIVPSILHYTEPGDLVLDGFAGSGMTGVAAQFCGTAPEDYRLQLNQERKKAGLPPPEWGARRAVLNDLSPAATFIAANYNTPFDVIAFAEAGEKLLDDAEQEIGWMYETLHTDGRTKGKIDYTVWSEIFSCPECTGEINFLKQALDMETRQIQDTFICPHCSAELTKKKLDWMFETQIDKASGLPWQRTKYIPVLISYKVGKNKFEKIPDQFDIDNLEKIDSLSLPEQIPDNGFPIEQMFHGPGISKRGYTNIHHMYLSRAAHAIGTLWKLTKAEPDIRLRSFLTYMVEQAIWGLSILNRYGPSHYSQVNKQMNGVYYISSLTAEVSPWYNIAGKMKRLSKAFTDYKAKYNQSIIQTGTSTALSMQDSCVDYIFTDPPFGANIPYADLNFLIESWHGVTSNTQLEAIIDRKRKKALSEYRSLMQASFSEYHRVLKPGRWMTVVFSNSRASVWNAIQFSLQEAGFVVAEVSELDKKQGSFKQVTSTTAVKKDLIISAYKPNGGLGKRLKERGSVPDSAWDFVRTHLHYLPVCKVNDNMLEFVHERNPRCIYDRMVAWFVLRGYPVPISTRDFHEQIRNYFHERDGMVFLPDQITEYDQKRAETIFTPQPNLFINDERSAIDWLTDFLRKRPSAYQEIHPAFFPELTSGWNPHEKKPELRDLLEDNFLQYDGKGDVPSQIHSYLSSNYKDLRNLEKSDSGLKDKAKGRWYVPDPNKADDLQQKRSRALLKEFETCKSAPGRLKEFRLEVLREGFRVAWADRDYQTIISVADKISARVLQEDEKLLLWYDQAITRLEE